MLYRREREKKCHFAFFSSRRSSPPLPLPPLPPPLPPSAKADKTYRSITTLTAATATPPASTRRLESSIGEPTPRSGEARADRFLRVCVFRGVGWGGETRGEGVLFPDSEKTREKNLTVELPGAGSSPAQRREQDQRRGGQGELRRDARGQEGRRGRGRVSYRRHREKRTVAFSFLLDSLSLCSFFFADGSLRVRARLTKESLLAKGVEKKRRRPR